RKLCFGGWFFYAIGAVVLTFSGIFRGSNVWAITIGGAFTLAGCATLCPTMYGMSLGLFSQNLGLIGGFISAICYLIISAAMMIVAYLPESSPAPIGWLYVGLAIITFALLALSLSSDNKQIPAASV
ncbi:MAG: Bcr/CflA family drug resistance efflux transporter, partial [Chthoniobacterales bacterium]